LVLVEQAQQMVLIQVLIQLHLLVGEVEEAEAGLLMVQAEVLAVEVMVLYQADLEAVELER
jgi:hypothetical protein